MGNFQSAPRQRPQGAYALREGTDTDFRASMNVVRDDTETVVAREDVLVLNDLRVTIACAATSIWHRDLDRSTSRLWVILAILIIGAAPATVAGHREDTNSDTNRDGMSLGSTEMVLQVPVILGI
ncbi:MAG: hypothetical protein Q9198_003213 [Flavoplaca austrocitrina]